MLTKTKGLTTTALAFALVISATQIVPSAAAEGSHNDSRIQAELAKSMDKAKFKDIQATAGLSGYLISKEKSF